MHIPALPHPPVSLVGRERDLGLLRAHLAATLAGRGSLVLIGGEAGIGKTALAETICREAEERGARVLVGRCFDLAETPAYGPWLYLFDRYHPDAALPPPPDAFSRRGIVGAVPSAAALFRQVLDFLTALSTLCPAVLLLDDLQWSDPASLDLLRFLTQSVVSLPLLLLVTYRVDELSRHHPLYQLFPALVREAAAERLDLGALNDNAVRSLIASRYPLPDADIARLTAYLHARAEGNPFFLGELVRTLEAEGALRATQDGWLLAPLTTVRVPLLLRQVIDGRTARLGEEALRVIAIAAVIGQEVPLMVLRTVGTFDEETLLTVIEHAATAHLLVETPDGLAVRFAHALIREAVYEGISPARRRLLHRQIAEILAAQSHPNADAVAYHYQRAGDDRAAAWLMRAGERAQAAYAWTTAAARFEAVLALMEPDDAERGWLLMRLARLLRHSDVARARAFADAAYGCAQKADDRLLTAYARAQRGMLACFAGDVTAGLPEMEAGAEALVTLSATERVRFAARAEAVLALAQVPDERGTVVGFHAFSGRYREALELGEWLIAEREAGNAQGEAPTNTYHGLCLTYAALGMPNEAAAMFARAHNAYIGVGHHVNASTVSQEELMLLVLPYRTEDITGRQRLAARAEAELVQASGALTGTVPPRIMWLPLLTLEGLWEEAERLSALPSAEERGSLQERAVPLQYLATLAWLRGDADRVRWAVDRYLPAGSATPPGTVMFFPVALALQRVVSALTLDTGDLATAQAWLDAHDRWLAWSGTMSGQSEGHALWAQYHRQAGEREQARTRAEAAFAAARAPRQPLALLAAHRLLGELATDAGRYDDAAIHLDASLALADACAAPYERALTLLAQAVLRATTGAPDATRLLLDEVRAICAPLGARPALARADALDARLAAMTDAPPAFPAGLSAREVEVLRLLAAGRSNREIADSLFLSVNTVRIHVVHILQKTDSANRAAAASFAHQQGLV